MKGAISSHKTCTLCLVETSTTLGPLSEAGTAVGALPQPHDQLQSPDTGFGSATTASTFPYVYVGQMGGWLGREQENSKHWRQW